MLPEKTDTTLPKPEEYARFLINRYLRANGLGRPSEIAYLLKSTKALVSARVKEMVSNGELLQISAAGKIYYALPASLELLNRRLARSFIGLFRLNKKNGAGSSMNQPLLSSFIVG